jgi:DNA-binding transcriptional regulator YiaG
VSLTFRNVDADPRAPVETWPYEAVVTCIERGTVGDWARLARAIRDQPYGVVAREVEEYLSYEQPWGVGSLLTRRIAQARRQLEQRERAAVAAEVRDLVERSGLSPAGFASGIGTSRTRLATYRSGSVTPSAALMLRMQELVRRLAGHRP